MVIGKEKFLIAEAGINHNGSLKKAFKLVEKQKKQGKCHQISNLYYRKRVKKLVQYTHFEEMS